MDWDEKVSKLVTKGEKEGSLRYFIHQSQIRKKVKSIRKNKTDHEGVKSSITSVTT